MKKKILAVIMTMTMVMSLAACGKLFPNLPLARSRSLFCNNPIRDYLCYCDCYIVDVGRQDCSKEYI